MKKLTFYEWLDTNPLENMIYQCYVSKIRTSKSIRNVTIKYRKYFYNKQ